MREFPHFHGNELEFSNSVFAVTPSGPYRLCMCDLVQFGPKAREEMYVKHFYVTGLRLYWIRWGRVIKYQNMLWYEIVIYLKAIIFIMTVQMHLSILNQSGSFKNITFWGLITYMLFHNVFKVVLHRSPRSPDIHDLSECHHLYDLGRH